METLGPFKNATMPFLKPMSQGSSTSTVHGHFINRRLTEKKMSYTDSDSIDFSARAISKKGLRNQRTGSAQSIPKCSPGHAYHSCLGLVQSCLWRCLSTNWYHSGERRVLSGTKSSVHSITFNTTGLSWSVPALQNAHQPCSQSSSFCIS